MPDPFGSGIFLRMRFSSHDLFVRRNILSLGLVVPVTGKQTPESVQTKWLNRSKP